MSSFLMPPGYGPDDVARVVPEPGKAPERNPFERDRARLLHSAALRRLGAKTQVLAPSANDFGRTRLTHSLEVAQVGRELGKVLGCDPDVVDTACLAHDLGHPPFGHNGEAALDAVAAPAGGFEGNAQTLRLLVFLEPKVVAPDGRSVGLNLTRACVDASIKYPWARGEGPPGSDPRKFGVYAPDGEVFAWIRAGAPIGARCVEAQVMDLADDVAYCVHDVEDGVVGGSIVPGDLRRQTELDRIVQAAARWYAPGCDPAHLHEAVERLYAQPYWVRGFDGSRADLASLKDMTSQLIGRFVTATENATRSAVGDGPVTRYNATLQVPAQTRAEIAVLKAVAAVYVMAPRANNESHRRERKVLTDLVEELSLRPDQLEAAFLSDYRQADNDAARLRAVVDQVASLTDISALSWHARLCGARK